ncbi:Virulence protein RhuM family protein [Desulfonema limicola]|uniref:Virulence protein RhuM family protein n=1 Tax=Desulfonema limicola TaxID=45656 RepID=A0A975B6U3_9BACT|nr:virulence RhuM family protein [Desulfonema limicola]QTA79876.1 Virulence protein RhuM family protein [Desulfonema limicola]
MKNEKKNSNELQVFDNFVVFKTAQGKVNIEVFFFEETIWLTQKKIAELFEKGRSTITEHLSNIFKDGELEEKSVCRNFRHTADDGKTYTSKFYNLQAITAVGFKVNSHRAIEFRKWANQILHEYIIKGFAMDDERLKQIKHFGEDYFEEMLERIREIRLSERRIYQKITDIYALSADYDSRSEITQQFFATVQNKLHWAITGKTAAEIIYTEADAKKVFMGLKTWKQAPTGKISKSDVAIAKNYLNEEHLNLLERIVTSYLDLAESRARNRKVMNMKDWDAFLVQFLELADYSLLTDAGKISMLEAKIKAESEFEKYRPVQDRLFESDFDREIKKLLEAKE